LSNCDEVELFLNGKSLGRQAMPRFSELKWKVTYASGTLSAKGYTGGKLVVESKVETTGAGALVQLAADRATIKADGEDVSVIAVSIADEQGRVVPVAGSAVSFELEGPGRIIGVGNGDPSCQEADKYFANPVIRTVPLNEWRWKDSVDLSAKNLPEVAVQFDDAAWKKADVTAESGPLGLRGRAVFRSQFTVTPDALTAAGIELWFGKLEGDVWVYLNGQKIGTGGNAASPSIFEVKSKLHAGANTLAVTVANYGEAAGVNKGVQLRLVDAPPAVAWSRSAFNGYAQVIVQATKVSGTIKVTARSAGLKSATIEVATKPVAARAALP
jgi:beta-galactosidase